MEHFLIITSVICIASSVFITPCDSLLGTQAASDHHHQLTHQRMLPRKLRISEDHAIKKDYNGGHQDFATKGAQQDLFLAGKALKNEANKKQTSIETWRDWVEAEGSDRSEYFTMDYSRVRRRRPIHNRSVPVAP